MAELDELKEEMKELEYALGLQAAQSIDELITTKTEGTVGWKWYSESFPELESEEYSDRIEDYV